jgi:SAM-dependent methyltransferase
MAPPPRPSLAVAADAFRLPFAGGAFDLAVSTLFFHHFSPEENRDLLCEMQRVARHGIAVLDLRRHRAPALFVSLAGPRLFRSVRFTTAARPSTILPLPRRSRCTVGGAYGQRAASFRSVAGHERIVSERPLRRRGRGRPDRRRSHPVGAQAPGLVLEKDRFPPSLR